MSTASSSLAITCLTSCEGCAPPSVNRQRRDGRSPLTAEVLLLRTTLVRSDNTSPCDVAYGPIDVLVGTVIPVDAFWTRSK